MKRWLCLLFLAVGVVFLLWIPHRPVSPVCIALQLGIDRSSDQSEFVSLCPGFCASRVLHSLGIALAHGNRSRPTRYSLRMMMVHPGWTIEGRQVLMRAVKIWLRVRRLPARL